MTIKQRISVTVITTNPQTLTSNSSVVRFFGLDVINFFLQDRGYQVFRALLGKQTFGFLALFRMEVVRVLALVAIAVFTSN
jgi:hypothetical protein